MSRRVMNEEQSGASRVEQELVELRVFKQAFDVHTELMTTFVSMSTRASGGLLLRSMLRQTLEICAKLTGAEESSLFWLDADGYVTESILARGVVIREQKDSVVGQVLEQGLAGWVYRNLKMGVIEDTKQDSRWLELPYQPYVTRSVLCFPVLRGNNLLAIITLMHSQVGYFDARLVRLMEICSQQMGMVLDLLRLYVEKLEHLSASGGTVVEPTPAKPEGLKLAQLGLFVIAEDGRFIYADQRLAEIFEYSLAELVGLGSLLGLVAQEHQEAFAQRLAQCFEGSLSHLILNFKGMNKHGKWVKTEFYARRTKLYGKTVMLGVMHAL